MAGAVGIYTSRRGRKGNPHKWVSDTTDDLAEKAQNGDMSVISEAGKQLKHNLKNVNFQKRLNT